MIATIIFYVFCVLFVANAILVVISRNPVHSALFLVMTFFNAAALWIFLQAEFLALVLVLVYVGAVMTLFLFVVMMLNLDLMPKRAGFIKYLPLGLMIVALIVATLVYVISPQHFTLLASAATTTTVPSTSNVAALGMVLYTHYVYPFELAAVLLLVAIIAAISLALRAPRSKKQNIKQQLLADPKERLTLVK